MDHLCYFRLVLLCFHARLCFDALWSPAGIGLTSWLLFVMSNCDVVTFQLISWVSSLGPVVNILAIFSNANILKKNMSIKIYHIKGIGCLLLISINIDAWGHQWYFPLIIRSAD